jgi:flagellar biosynthesis/type III secretory pathway M-ring protein FliF/YscJ
MGKRDKPDGFGTDCTDTDQEESRERRYEQALKSARSAVAREDKERLVEVIKDWLRE